MLSSQVRNDELNDRIGMTAEVSLSIEAHFLKVLVVCRSLRRIHTLSFVTERFM